MSLHRLVGSLGGLLPPGIGVDIDDVAVLDEAIDQGGDASGAGKTEPQYLKDKLVVMAMDLDSCRRLTMLYRRSAARLSQGK